MSTSDLANAASAKRMAMVRAAMTMDERLDDVTRARIGARIEARIAAPARAAGRAWWPIAAAAIAGAAVAAIVIVPRGDHAVASAPALIAPADTTLTATIGVHTRAALVGPARLEVVASEGDATTVRLDRGTLYASFEGGAGRSLRVVAPGAVVDVVGTLFAVEAGGPRGTCVSVSHGRVRVTMGARVRMVDGGQRVCSSDDAPHTIDPTIDRALATHEGVTATAPPPAPAPANTGRPDPLVRP
ncbi:MAG TPA: FecR domain-containing protein, partial [Kofleriaceae bacterium]|nr:FecR domain-containing protein [Kofleriaceae bacterium]